MQQKHHTFQRTGAMYQVNGDDTPSNFHVAPPKKPKRKKKRIIAIIIALALFITAGAIAYHALFPNNEPLIKAKAKKGHEINWEALLAENPDTVGWLHLPKTQLDTPVVQTGDNKFYLNHNYKKEYDYHGLPFLDKDYKWGISKNSVIYGHSIFRDGFTSQFDVIHKFVGNQKYYNKHKTIYYDRPDGKGGYGKWRIFAVIRCNPYYNYRQMDFTSEQDFQQFIEGIEDKNTISSDDHPKYGDELLVLSTCEEHVNRVALIAYRLPGTGTHKDW